MYLFHYSSSLLIELFETHVAVLYLNVGVTYLRG